MPKSWYVAQTKPKHEPIAVRELGNQGLETFLPYLRTRHLGNLRLRPLFPSYLFVRLDVHRDPWRSVSGTRGVARLLMSGPETPSRVPDPVLEGLMRDGGIVDDISATCAFLKGQVLRFTGGPLAGREGVCQSSSSVRVALLLSLLGRESVVYSDPRVLVPA